LSKYKQVKLGHNKGTNDVSIVVLPSKEKIKNHFKEISSAIKKSASAIDLIRNVNPILRGWRSYFKYSDARTYGQLPGAWDSRVYVKLKHWVKRRLNKSGRPDICWTRRKNDNWVFHAIDPITKKEVYLDKYSNCSWTLQAYNRIDSKKSPYDGDVPYWCQHSGYRLMGPSSPKREFLLKKQKGFCKICLIPFSPEELFLAEIDHIKPRSKGGSEKWSNQRLIQKSCHVKITLANQIE
jgi:RNA-directed DNA polymerase